MTSDAAPPTGEARFDVVLCRHLMWTLPDPTAALTEWLARIRPGGLLVLVEGRRRQVGQAGVPYVAGADTLPWQPATNILQLCPTHGYGSGARSESCWAPDP